MATITADSVPDYDAWGPDDYWSCSDWIQWHRELVKRYGKEQANVIWISAADKTSFGGHEEFCRYDSSFANYFKQNGIDVGNILSHIANTGSNVVENIGDAAGTTTKILKWLIPTAIVLAVIGVFIYFGNKYKIFKLS